MKMRISNSIANLKKLRGFIFLIALFLTTVAIVYSARQPLVSGDNNEWGTVLNQYLNETFDQNGSIKAAVNNTISLWNITGNGTYAYIFTKDGGASVLIGTLNTSLNLTEKLVVIGNVNISGYLNISGDLIVNKKFNVTSSSGNVNVEGTLDAGNLRIKGSDVQVQSSAFNLGNYSTEYSSTGYKKSNFTSDYSSEYASTGYKRGNLSSDLSAGVAATIVTSSFTTDNAIVNQNIFIIGNISNTNIANLNVNGSLFPTLDDLFDVGNGSRRWRNANFSGTIFANILDAITVRFNGKNVEVEADAFKISNFTSAYDNRADRFGLSNYSAEYSSTGYKLANFTSNLASRLAEFFNLGNYSTEYASTGYKLSNFTSNYDARTDRFGVSNGTALPFSAFVLANLSRIGNVDINTSGSLNVSQNVTFTALKNCDTIDTNAVGLLTCGVDASGADPSAFNLGNLTGYEGGISVNATYLKSDVNATFFTGLPFSNFQKSNDTGTPNWNTTSSFIYLNESSLSVIIGNNTGTEKLVIIGNISTRGNIYTINGTIFDNGTLNRSISLDLYNKSISLVNYNQSVSLNNYLIATNGSISLWNITGTTIIYPRFIGANIGLDTITPDNQLTIVGFDTDSNLALQGILHLNITNSYNKTVTNFITLDHDLNNPVNSTGGIGISILFRARDNASQMYKIGNISAILHNSTNGSQAGALTFSTSVPDTGDNAFGHLIERLRINGRGIGVNNTAPNETLAVKGTLSVVSGSGVQGLYQDPRGNVGIGTSTPNATLDVKGNIKANNLYQFLGKGNLTAANAWLNITLGSCMKHIRYSCKIAGYSAAGVARIEFNNISTATYSSRVAENVLTGIMNTSTFVSGNGIPVALASITGVRSFIADIRNDPGSVKEVSLRGHSGTAVATTAPTMNLVEGIWTTATACITQINLFSNLTTTTLSAGTQCEAFGINDG